MTDPNWSHSAKKGAGIINLCLLLVIAFLWASAFGAIKIAVAEVGPVTVAAIRASIAAMILLALLRLSGPIDWRIFSRNFGSFFVIGGLGTALPFALIPFAETRIDSSLAGLLMSVGPLATMAGAWAFGLEDDLSKRRFFGLVIGLIGVFVIFIEGFVDIGAGHVVAQCAAVGASLCYVCGNLMVRRLSFVPPLTISAMAMSLGALLLWPMAIGLETIAPASWSWRSWQMLLWLGVMPTAFAFSVRYYLISRAGASFTSYVGYLIPAIALLIGAVWLGEAISTDKIAALVLILAGLLFAQQRKLPFSQPSKKKG